MNTILEFIRVAGNIILHSIRTALPCWVAVFLVAAILIVRSITTKKKEKKQDGNYSMEGMSLGMCFGLLIGTVLGDNLGIGISLGALIGLAIGLCMPKKQENEEK